MLTNATGHEPGVARPWQVCHARLRRVYRFGRRAPIRSPRMVGWEIRASTVSRARGKEVSTRKIGPANWKKSFGWPGKTVALLEKNRSDQLAGVRRIRMQNS